MGEAAQRFKILCIDDTPSARVLVRRLLARRYEVLEADEGLKGIELAAEARPDLVLVDLHMPNLTGYEVATRLKSIFPQVPVVALTADVTDHVRERVLAAGCDGYLSKPIDPDAFEEQVQGYLGGAREELTDDSYRTAYQQTLVARLEEKVRELTQALERNQDLYAQNLELLEQTQRRARLLEAGARVGQAITSILDIDELLSATVDVICEEFGFSFAGIYLLDEGREWAVLRAGRGDAGQRMIDRKHKLRVGGPSVVGAAAQLRLARVAEIATVDGGHSDDLPLPLSRSEIALPLTLGDEAIGVLSVHSAQDAAFPQDDVTALQSMADQLAVAIDNARLLNSLREAHRELVRTKTYEAIATATGEAIHWVGNKAAPIPGSVERVREDAARYICLANAILSEGPPALREHAFSQVLSQAADELARAGTDPAQVTAELRALSDRRLRRMLSVESILEDLEIIQHSAQAILSIKEDLIGPARKRVDERLDLPDLLAGTIASLDIDEDVVRTVFADNLPPVRADRAQLDRVFTNLIKNAMEAMENLEDKRLVVWARPADEPGYVAVEVIDSGVGIAAEDLDKVWMAFYTTKGVRGGTGLGLPACAQIVNQLGGRITLESEPDYGTTFTVILPAEAAVL
jgi:signal transduction histidine kinase/DNA-binding NarL/FixJ family response regulator